MNKTLLNRSRLAAGVSVICILFLLETWNAHRLAPHPASPLIWSVLGLAATVSGAVSVWFAVRRRRSVQRP